MGPSSFQWCPVTGQGAMGTNWSTGSSIWTWGRTSSLWGWESTGTGCPGRLWSLLLWRYSRPTWMWSSTACCRWPCFGRGVGLHDPQKSLPTPTILWFCKMKHEVTLCRGLHWICGQKLCNRLSWDHHPHPGHACCFFWLLADLPPQSWSARSPCLPSHSTARRWPSLPVSAGLG